jgi:hypothetical protein
MDGNMVSGNPTDIVVQESLKELQQRHQQQWPGRANHAMKTHEQGLHTGVSGITET